MDAIRLRQIDEALGYDKHTNAMVFDLEKKRVAQQVREMLRDDYAMIDAQRMMDVNDAANSLQLMLATGRSLIILTLSAEASLTNGFIYIKELLMQHHNFYLNCSYKLLTDNGVDVYTVKTDAFTIRQSQLESAKELLNWEEGIGC